MLKKSERLIYLLNFLNPASRVSLRELAVNCNTSERTIYRDINELTRIGYPIDFDEGYYLKTSAPHSVLNKLTDSELRMLKFALETHPLGKLFPFHELAARLKCTELSKVEAKTSRPGHGEHTINRISGRSDELIPDSSKISEE
ncbi:MAG TPA: HTH domain-containing protein [candidate division Zixibacteria bacterium]|nr:HTH domain-containing protein [candidate division Zixibacteria bacterium]